MSDNLLGSVQPKLLHGGVALLLTVNFVGCAWHAAPTFSCGPVCEVMHQLWGHDWAVAGVGPPDIERAGYHATAWQHLEEAGFVTIRESPLGRVEMQYEKQLQLPESVPTAEEERPEVQLEAPGVAPDPALGKSDDPEVAVGWASYFEDIRRTQDEARFADPSVMVGPAGTTAVSLLPPPDTTRYSSAYLDVISPEVIKTQSDNLWQRLFWDMDRIEREVNDLMSNRESSWITVDGLKRHLDSVRLLAEDEISFLNGYFHWYHQGWDAQTQF